MLKDIPEDRLKEQWAALYADYRKTLSANRKSGKELEEYFLCKYEAEEYNDEAFVTECKRSIKFNPNFRKKLPERKEPEIHAYKVENVLVGIDIIGGNIHIYSEDVGKMLSVYDDLFVYRGLDAEDLENPFTVAEYAKLTGHTDANGKI